MLNGYYTIFSATAFCARYCRRIVASPGFIVTRSRPPTAWTVRSPDESTTFALLRRPNYPISLVAGECGWQTDAYLKRLFKRTTGLTMREWRKRESGA